MTPSEEVLIEGAPLFVQTLWKLVNDPETDHIISWNKSGDGFIVHSKLDFFRDLMSNYFKYNCVSSFRRALNSFGFKKIPDSGNMVDYGKTMEFRHRHFQRGKPQKLKYIKGQKTRDLHTKTQGIQQKASESTDLADIVRDVNWVHNKQSKVGSQVSAMKKESTTLWRELVILRQKHKKQQQIVNKVVDFLDTLVSHSPRIRARVEVHCAAPEFSSANSV